MLLVQPLDFCKQFFLACHKPLQVICILDLLQGFIFLQYVFDGLVLQVKGLDFLPLVRRQLVLAQCEAEEVARLVVRVRRPCEGEHDGQDPGRVEEARRHDRAPECEEGAPDEARAQAGEADAEEGAQRRVQERGAHLRQRALDPAFQRAPALDELVHDVCELVDADAQTHDQEEERDDVQLEAALLNAHLHDQHHVHDERPDQHRALDVVEEQLHHSHDGRARAQQEVAQFGLQRTLERLHLHEVVGLGYRVFRALLGDRVGRVHHGHHVARLGLARHVGNERGLDRALGVEGQSGRDLRVDGHELPETRLELRRRHQAAEQSDRRARSQVVAVPLRHKHSQFLLPRVLILVVPFP